MKRRRILIAVFVIIILALVGYFRLYQPHDNTEHRPDRRSTEETLTFGVPASAPNEAEEGDDEDGEPDMVAAKLATVTDSPLRNDPLGRKAVERVDKVGRFSETNEGISVRFYRYDGFDQDTPVVALRFMKKNKRTGKLNPLVVEHCWFRRRKGSTTLRTDEEKEPYGHLTVEGHTMWLAAAPPGAAAVRALRFGRRYHLEFKVVTKTRMYRGSEVEDEYFFYESIVKLPDHIPPGKMAVIDVIAEHLDGTIEETPRPDLTYITGSITQPLPPTQTAWYAAYTHEEEEYSGFARIEDDGTFDLGERKLGGMLRLAEKGGNGVSWMYVNEVRQDELTLPEDADLVIPRDQIQTVKIVVPAAALKQKMVGLWVKRDRDDSGPLCWVACRRPVQQQLQKTQTIDVQLPTGAGEYWVDAFYGFDAKGERNWVTLGRIALGPTPNDTPLEIVPPKD